MFSKKSSGATENEPKLKSTTTASSAAATTRKKITKTQITVKCDIGFPNGLYIRGNGANLSWDRGVPLKNVKSDEWIWETESEFSPGEFKVLINDKQFEWGENHPIRAGATITYSPNF